MTPDLQPVRRRGRPGIDRGWIVLVAIFVVIGVAVAQPWGANPERVEIAGDASADELASTPPPGESGVPETLVSMLAPLPRADDRAWLAAAGAPLPVSAPFVRAVPETVDLGEQCDGGALMPEGIGSVAVTLPEPTRPSRVSRAMIRRLFDGLPPVSMPVTLTSDYADGVGLVSSDAGPWPPGHYAVTVDVFGRTGTVVMCIGRMIRLVDYSLITFVPNPADGAEAREALIRVLAH